MYNIYVDYSSLELGKMQRRGSSQGHASDRTTNGHKLNFHQYHKMSETFTDNFPIKATQPKLKLSPKKPPHNYFQVKKKQPTLTLDEIDQKLEYRSQPFTFNQEPQTRTEHQLTQAYINAKNKKFDFENYQETSKQRQHSLFFEQKSNLSQSFMSALDDFVDYLSQSENLVRSTQQTDQSEITLLQKLNFVKETHERLVQRATILSKKKHENAQQVKHLRSENEQLTRALLETKMKLENECMRTQKLQSQNKKMEQTLKSTCARGKYLQNALIKEQLDNENNKMLYRRVMMKYDIWCLSKETLHLSLYQQLPKTRQNQRRPISSNKFQIEARRDDLLSQFLQRQMNQLRKNNKDIQRMQQSMHVTRRFSSDVAASSHLDSDSVG